MKNSYAVTTAARQIIKVCERIDALATATVETETQGQSNFDKIYEEQLEGQIADLQQLVLGLTGVAFGDDAEANTDDGSAFAEGELNAVKGEENTDCGAEGDQK